MNIALLIPSLGGGGAERVAQQIGNHYVEKGNNVFYFLGSFGIKNDYDVKGEIIYTGIGPLDTIEQCGKAFAFFNSAKSVLHMRMLKKKYCIDVSISFMEDFNYLNVLSSIGEKVIVRVCTIISECEEFSGKILYRRNWIHRIYSRADRVVVMSQFAFYEMRDIYGIQEHNIAVIPNPVSSVSGKEKDDMNWKYGSKAVITIGRLSPEKQQDRLLRAFRVVADKLDNARLIILGKGPLSQYLHGLCRIYGLEEKVVFVGFTKYPGYFLNHSKVFVMTSKIEGFSCATIEAMSCGVPVVATDSPGGIQDIVGRYGTQYGILTPPMPRIKISPQDALLEEEKILGCAILSVLEKRELYEDLRQRSLLRSKDYKIEKVMTMWDRLIYGG